MTALLDAGSRVDDRYEVIGELGGGGMGLVYEVEHVALGRRFALKVLRVTQVDDELVHRFEREARALARVHSPRVAQVSDFGVAEGIGPYYVMELVAGESLEARIKRDGPIPLGEAIALAIHLCEAVEDVHREGLVHRDLKPGNIGLTTGPIPVKLLDFGLAAGVDDAFLTRITQSHQVLGSLPYIAPEQFSGARPGPPQDMWALGVVIYEMLTAQLPFEAVTTAALMHRILTAPPPDLDAFPAALREIVQRLLMKNPSARIGSAQEAADLLRALDIASMPRTIESPTVHPSEVRTGQLLDLSTPEPNHPAPPAPGRDWPEHTSDAGHELGRSGLQPTLPANPAVRRGDTRRGGWGPSSERPPASAPALGAGALPGSPLAPSAPVGAPPSQPPPAMAPAQSGNDRFAPQSIPPFGSEVDVVPHVGRPERPIWQWVTVGVMLSLVSAATFAAALAMFDDPADETPTTAAPPEVEDTVAAPVDPVLPADPEPRAQLAPTDSPVIDADPRHVSTTPSDPAPRRARPSMVAMSPAPEPTMEPFTTPPVTSPPDTTPPVTTPPVTPPVTTPPDRSSWMGGFIGGMDSPTMRAEPSMTESSMTTRPWQGGFIRDQ